MIIVCIPCYKYPVYELAREAGRGRRVKVACIRYSQATHVKYLNEQSFFLVHKLIEKPLCWHQTVWHKLKLIPNWVCMDFDPAFVGYIKTWPVSFYWGLLCGLQAALHSIHWLSTKTVEGGEKARNGEIFPVFYWPVSFLSLCSRLLINQRGFY